MASKFGPGLVPTFEEKRVNSTCNLCYMTIRTLGKQVFLPKIKAHLWHLFLRHPYNSEGKGNRNYPKDNKRNWILKKWCKSSVFYFISCHVKLNHSEKYQSASMELWLPKAKWCRVLFLQDFLYLPSSWKNLPWCRQHDDVIVPLKPTKIGGCGFGSCPQARSTYCYE